MSHSADLDIAIAALRNIAEGGRNSAAAQVARAALRRILHSEGAFGRAAADEATTGMQAVREDILRMPPWERIAAIRRLLDTFPAVSPEVMAEARRDWPEGDSTFHNESEKP